MRGIGILGIFAALVAFSADAMDANDPCPGLLEENDVAHESSTRLAQPLLTDNQCEALKTRELRAPLLEIPQNGEEPMELSLGFKNNGGTLRFKIPFSF